MRLHAPDAQMIREVKFISIVRASVLQNSSGSFDRGRPRGCYRSCCMSCLVPRGCYRGLCLVLRYSRLSEELAKVCHEIRTNNAGIFGAFGSATFWIGRFCSISLYSGSGGALIIIRLFSVDPLINRW